MMSREDLLSRGYCCGLGCVKCPFYPKGSKGSTAIFELPTSVNCSPSCTAKTMQEGECICYLDFLENK